MAKKCSIIDNLKNNAKEFKQTIAEPQSTDETIIKGYFSDYRFNIYGGKMDRSIIDMYNDGDGNELASKACAFHSSSMLAYNCFHWISKEQPLTLSWPDGNRIEYSRVRFEAKLSVLKNSSRKSNMDVVLTNDNRDVVFIESKFLEYTNKGEFKFSESYENKSNYYINGEEWSKFISEMLADKKDYCDGIKQEICHLIAITNWLKNSGDHSIEAYKKGSDVRFINLVFDPLENLKEHTAYMEYCKRYTAFHDKVKNANHIDSHSIKMDFYPYSWLWAKLQDQIPKELKEYLNKHYFTYSNYKP